MRGSNLRIMAYRDLKMSFESSKSQGPGPNCSGCFGKLAVLRELDV